MFTFLAPPTTDPNHFVEIELSQRTPTCKYKQKCPTCNLLFMDERTLAQHLCELVCTECDMTFDTKLSLDSHMETHQKKPVQACPSCGEFPQLQTVCQGCLKTFGKEKFSAQCRRGFAVEHSFLCATCQDIATKFCVFEEQTSTFVKFLMKSITKEIVTILSGVVFIIVIVYILVYCFSG